MKSKRYPFFLAFEILLLIKILFILFYIIKKNIIKLNYFRSAKEGTICLCTFGKEENKYAREFVEYYIRYGVNKIIIYDNNNINGESFEPILNDFIKNKTVQIINCRGEKKIQLKKMNHCYINNFYKYNWIMFYDMDEFIHLKNYQKIIHFLNEKQFNKCQIVSLTSIFHTDNNQLYYQNKSLEERFPFFNKNISIFLVKSILRGNISGLKISNPHFLIKYQNITRCNGFGHKIKKNLPYIERYDIKNYYINHYAFKSTEEFANKLTRGDVISGAKKLKIFDRKIKIYFTYNTISMEKINLIEKKLGIKLNEIRKKLKYKLLLFL